MISVLASENYLLLSSKNCNYNKNESKNIDFWCRSCDVQINVSYVTRIQPRLASHVTQTQSRLASLLPKYNPV